MPYEFLEDIATADIAFQAWGKDLKETFVAAADATMNVMVEELESIEPKERRELKLENDQLDMLLFDLLQELIYYKDAEELLLRVRQIEIEEKDHRHLLKGVASGEKIDRNRHRLWVDVKAVTLHRFQLAKTKKGWETQVILDI
jgi:SHS2 domain-containing protein